LRFAFGAQQEVKTARFDPADFACSVIQPLLPARVRGGKRRAERQVLNSMFWRLRTGAPWAARSG